MSDTTGVSRAVEGPEDFGKGPEGEAKRWHAEIKQAQKECSDWHKTGREILQRYRDERPGRKETRGEDVRIGRHMNILWSNVQTLAPAIFATPPEPVVQRRYGDEDDVARVGSTILQRVIKYQLEENDFPQIMRECVQDSLLPGRGVVWVRYEPHFGREPDYALPLLPPAMPTPPMPTGGPAQAAQMPGAAGVQQPPAPPPMPGVPVGAPVPPIGGSSSPVAAPGMMPQPPGMPPGVGMGMPSPDPLLGALTGAQLPLEQAPRSRGRGKTPDDGGLQIHEEAIGEGEFVAWERACIDHVGVEDFLTNPARTWAEVRWVARRVLMTKDDGKDRFGPMFEDVPLSWHPTDLSEQDRLEPINQIFARAEVWEIWDKPSRCAIWLAKDFSEKLLDKRDDPLHLPEFFPCPRPLSATLTTESLIPVPDYKEYQDQALEIDTLTARIFAIAKAIKVTGVYDAAQDGIKRMFLEGTENELVPVNQWATFSQLGGLKGTMDMLDVSGMAESLEKLIAIRAQAKNDLYEVTGLSDIIRGSSVATETATAQQLKSQWGTMRLRARQGEAARFCRDVVRLVAHVICEHFQSRTILMMSDIAHQNGTDAALAMQAIALLKDDKTRPLRIDIETDSTILQDQQNEQQGRLQFVQMASGFMQQALPAVVQYPQIAPLLGQILLFAVRSFPQGAELEGAFEQAVAQLQQAAKIGPPGGPQPPDPKMIVAQAQVQDYQSKIQERQANIQRDDMESRAKIAMEGAKLGLERESIAAESERTISDMMHGHHAERINTMLDAAKTQAQIDALKRKPN